jgi:hypothetical protein
MGLAQTNAARKTPALPAFASQGRRAWRTSQAHGKQEKDAGTTDFFAFPDRYLVLCMLAMGHDLRI